MHMRMGIYPRAAVERAMKLQEVLLRATAGKIKWWQNPGGHDWTRTSDLFRVNRQEDTNLTS